MFNNILSSITSLYRSESLYNRVYIYLRLKFFLRIFQKLEELTIKKGRILDLGCSFGVLANYLSIMSEQREITGIDNDAKRIKVAQRTTQGRKNINFFYKDVNEIEGDLLFEAIVLTDFLHHLNFKQQDTLLGKISHSLKEGGQLIIMDVMEKPKWKYILSYLADLALYLFKPKHYYRQAFEMKKILEDLGFTVETIPYHQGSPFASVIYHAKKYRLNT